MLKGIPSATFEFGKSVVQIDGDMANVWGRRYFRRLQSRSCCFVAQHGIYKQVCVVSYSCKGLAYDLRDVKRVYVRGAFWEKINVRPIRYPGMNAVRLKRY